jgi:hypothetical protein
MSDNPYQAPVTAVADVDAPAADAERVRREHIGHERQLRAVGALYLFGGVLGLLGGIALIVGSIGAERGGGEMTAIAVLYVAISAFSLVLGWGYRKLAPWVRIPGTVLAAIGLLGIPIGTIISLAILWMIWSAKGKVVLSPQYAAIVAATPHVRYRMTVVDWIVWGLLAAVLIGLVAMLMMAR